MKKLASVLAHIPKLLVLELVYVVDHYPARFYSALASGVVFVALSAGIVVPQATVVHALELIVPLLAAGEATHRKVSPVR